jgi:hypothetical protein
LPSIQEIERRAAERVNEFETGGVRV